MTDEPLLSLDRVSVTFRTDRGEVAALREISYEVRPGEILALVGESGSGKSVSTRAALRLLPRNAAVSGHIRFRDTPDISQLTPGQLRQLRGSRVSMIFQEPAAALDPVYRVGDQIIEAIRLHRRLTRAQARDRAVELFEIVQLPDPTQLLRRYPHELSGGQKQRVMIAMAVALDPELLIADEPTTALDVTVQAEILRLLADLRDRIGTAIVLITHNMGVVAELADRVVVLRHGEVIETGDVFSVLGHPSRPYTRELLAAVPRIDRVKPQVSRPNDSSPVVAARALSVDYGNGRRRFHALDGIDLQIQPGEFVAVVGESGSGKSTLARTIAGILPPNSGTVAVRDASPSPKGVAARRDFARRVGMVFQEPRTSLNPHMTIAEAIGEPLRAHGWGSANRAARVDELMGLVRLDPALKARYPHELSGGQTQRVGIARALALGPELLIADEPTSALDVSVQASVLELLKTVQRDMDFACLFITHDLAVVAELADRVIVMRHGRIVEDGPTGDVLTSPRAAYTRALIDAVPVPDPIAQRARRPRPSALSSPQPSTTEPGAETE